MRHDIHSSHPESKGDTGGARLSVSLSQKDLGSVVSRRSEAVSLRPREARTVLMPPAGRCHGTQCLSQGIVREHSLRCDGSRPGARRGAQSSLPDMSRRGAAACCRMTIYLSARGRIRRPEASWKSHRGGAKLNEPMIADVCFSSQECLRIVKTEIEQRLGGR